MKRFVIHRPGGYRRLELEEHPDPLPAPGEVLVGTRAVGVNYADSLARWGVHDAAKRLVGWPITPGFEFAGEVLEAPSSKAWRPGDPVLGLSSFGAYASHIVVPEHQLFRKPERLSFEQAGGFPGVFLTAFHALFQALHVQASDNVLVHSAAGGVGGALIELCRVAGCWVVGVVGKPHKVAVVESMGAAATIDRSRQRLWEEAKRLSPEGYDVILDANGPSTLRQSYAHLAPGGRLVVYGFHSALPRSKAGGGGRLARLGTLRRLLSLPRFDPLRMTRENRSVLAFNVVYLLSKRTDLLREGMTTLLDWVEDQRIEPLGVTPFPFEEAADAQRLLESGETTGKLVLTL
jgi:NADPH:quinone reductase-like Zn-dependent oxidoreductase